VHEYAGFSWLRIKSCGRLLAYIMNFGSIKCGEFLEEVRTY
jgi:hypothetical protein